MNHVTSPRQNVYWLCPVGGRLAVLAEDKKIKLPKTLAQQPLHRLRIVPLMLRVARLQQSREKVLQPVRIIMIPPQARNLCTKRITMRKISIWSFGTPLMRYKSWRMQEIVRSPRVQPKRIGLRPKRVRRIWGHREWDHLLEEDLSGLSKKKHREARRVCSMITN